MSGGADRGYDSEGDLTFLRRQESGGRRAFIILDPHFRGGDEWNAEIVFFILNSFRPTVSESQVRHRLLAMCVQNARRVSHR